MDLSPRASRSILWLTAALALPVPIWVLGPGWVPPLRLAMLAAISLAVMLTESARGAVGLAAAVFAGQAAVYLALLWAAAHLVSRALARLPRRRSAALVWVVVALALGLAASHDLYRDPYHGRSARSGLLDAYR